ncbi:MAG: PfkB family carbohydrate kinase [Candidatus Sumerlaeota bacterium]|nr:PfkB family carbohydrate kinase [Candidatus Sumerlaeota bacterium]
MRTEEKIKELEELAGIVAALKAQGKVVVQCHGTFDLMHPGHIKHLEAARRRGDALIVTVTPDEFVKKGPNRPVFPLSVRMESLASLECVDYVAANRWQTAEKTIRLLKPSFFAKGNEFADRGRDVAGFILGEEEAIKSVGGDLLLTGEITFSSTQILNEFFNVYPEQTREYLARLKRDYTPDDVIRLIRGLGDLKVLVVGDTIIDEYSYCVAMGKVEKAPIVAARYQETLRFPGGALAVANHLANFAGEVGLVSVLGDINSFEPFIADHLDKQVKRRFFTRPDSPTTLKRRYLEHFENRKIFEIQYLNDSPLDETLAREVAAHLDQTARNYDLLLIADFGHGFIAPIVREAIARQPVFKAVNEQKNCANFGFNLVTKYRGVDYVSIDEKELRLPFQDRFATTEELTGRLAREVGCARINITLGVNGDAFFDHGRVFQAPAMTTKTVDTVGAGDAVLAVTSLWARQEGLPAELLPFVANCVGALAANILGNREPVRAAELFRFITAALK